MPACLIMTTVGDEATADGLAEFLVSARLAACVQLLPIKSFYTWEGRLNRDSEILLLIKTRAELYAAVETALRSRHPYALPEIVQLPITAGLPEYLDWLAASTQD